LCQAFCPDLISFGSFVHGLEPRTEVPPAINSISPALPVLQPPVSFGWVVCDRSRWLTADLCWLLPLLLNHASRPAFLGDPVFGLAEDESPSSAGAIASAQPATKLQLLSNFASSCHTRDEFSTSFESPIPRLAPRGRISDFYRIFHLPAGQEMFVPIPYWATN
jgi:hypothetical protein